MRQRTIPLSALIAIAVAIDVMHGPPALAEVSECVSYDDPKRLMECYRKLLTGQDMSAGTPERLKVGPYILVKSEDDSEIGWTLTASDMTPKGWRHLSLRTYAKNLWVRSEDQSDAQRFEDLRPSIWIRCVDGDLTGFMDWGIFLDVRNARITFRFDEEPVRAAVPHISADRQRIEPISKDQLIRRISAMFGKHTLVAQVTPEGEQPLAVDFDIYGLETAIQPLRTACPW